MKIQILFGRKLPAILLVLFLSPSLSAQEKRAMTLEDIMNFHHMQSPVINHDGSRLAYTAVPDRGDGYGVLVSATGNIEHRFERAVSPRFSAGGDWLLFTRRPPLSDTEGKPASDIPADGALLVRSNDGSVTEFDDVKNTTFSTVNSYLFIHKRAEEDSTLTESQNKKLREAGTTLIIKNLRNNDKTALPFVDLWTVDSLSTSLVYTRKDTLDGKNGLWYQPLGNLSTPPSVIDTTGNSRFGRFSWHEGSSTLAYLKACNSDNDSTETAMLYRWRPDYNSPVKLAGQEDAPEGLFLPFDNRLVWNNNGQMLFFGFRPERFAKQPIGKPVYDSVIDSIRQQSGIDVWHGDDPLIKTHEKMVWNQVSRQNLLSVLHLSNGTIIRLACEDIPDLEPASTGNYALATTSVPHSKRITWEGRFRDAWVINLQNGERTLVVEDISDQVQISPNGRFVVYFAGGNWHSYEIATRKRINLTGGLDVQFFNETDDTPSTPSSYRIAGWMEDGVSALIYDRYDIWHIDASTGKTENITAGEGRKTNTILRIRKLDSEPLIASGENLLLEGFNEATKERAIYSSRVNRNGISLLRNDNRNLTLRLISGDKSTLVYTREAYDEFPDLWVTDLRFRNPVRVSNLGEQIKEYNWGTAGLVEYTSADGIPLQGVVIKPGDYDPSRRYPVLVYFYEKFSQRLYDFNQTVINHRPSFAWYASNGYVVYLPDVHFKEGRPGMSAVNSLVPAVQKLVKTGIADPDAIGLHGHSWSGYQAAYVVTQTDIFKAAVAGAPVSNMTSAYGGIRWGSGLARQFQYETGQSRLGSSIFDRRYLYIENSPLFYAHEINTPLMIMHGDVDEAVPWEQSIELYLAMRRAGKDIIFLQYRDEPHHPQKYSNKIDYTIRMKEYFDYHLKGMEPASWITEGVPYSGN